MQSIFSSVLKNKKIFIFAFLFFAAIFFTGNTQTAKAILGLCDFDNLPNCINSCTVFTCRVLGTNEESCKQQCIAKFSTSQVIISETLPESRDSNQCHFDPITGNGLDKGIGASIGLLLLYSTWWIAYNVRDYFSIIFNWSNNLQITTDPIFIRGWMSVRDLANMFIVLAFIAIGIATALRFKDYEAKKLLPKLIIIALLINFSAIFCGLIIDSANITMKSLTLQGSSTSPAPKFIYSMEMLGQKTLTTDSCLNDTWNFAGRAALYSGIYLLVALVLLFLMFVLIERYAMLAFLFILAPAAFFAWSLPFTNKWWKTWWETMLKWAFIGVTAAFVLYIANSLIGTNSEIGITYIIIILVFLFIGFKLTIKSGGVFANAMLGIVSGRAGLAMGAVKAGGMAGLKGLADKSGVSRLGTAIKDRTTQTLENVGLMKAGRTTASQQSRLNDKDRLNRINSMTAEQMVQEIEHPRTGNNAHYDRAAMVKRLAENNQLGMLQAGHRDVAMAQAVQFGVRPKDLIGGMQSADIANIINNPGNAQYDAEARAAGFKSLSKRNDLDLIHQGQRQPALDNAIRHGARIEEIEKSDYHYALQNGERRQRIITANPTFTDAQIDAAAIDQALDENITSMSHEQLRGVDPAHLTARRVDRLTPDKINAFQYASQQHRDEIYGHFEMGGQLFTDLETAYSEYQQALARGDQATATNRYAEVRRLTSLESAAGRLP